MPFFLAAGLALLLETAGPLVVIALVAWRVRPAAEAGVWPAGMAGLAIGAGLCAVSWAAKASAARILPELGISAAFVVGLVEESLRFAAVYALFRGARGRPLVAGLFLGLGWGVAEIVPVLVQQVAGIGQQIHVYGGAENVPVPFASLLVPAERLGAILLHVALTGFAVAAIRGSGERALSLFGAAVVAHALLDAWVLAMFGHYGERLAAGDATGMIVLEVVFVAGGAVLLVGALRLGAGAPRSG